MTMVKERSMVSLPVLEYKRLKHIDKKFGEFFAYLNHLSDIQKSRSEVVVGKITSQEKLFKQLGI